MTRGYIVLIKNGEIYKVVESYGDSYLSGLGIKIINMMEKNTLVEAFKDIKEVDYSDTYVGADTFNEPVKPIFHLLGYETAKKELKSLPLPKESFIRTKDTKDHIYYAYTYMYNIDKDYLDIVHYGRKQIRLTRNLIPSIRKFIELDELQLELSYDEKTGRTSKHYSKEVKELFKTSPTPETLQSIKDNFTRKLYIDNFKHSDVYRNAYKRRVKDLNEDTVAEFVIEESNRGKVELILCTPFYRIIIKRTTSKTKAEEFIRDIVNKEENSLLSYKEVCGHVQRSLDFLKEMEKMIFDTEHRVDIALDKIMNTTVKEIDNIGPYFGSLVYLPKDSINKNLSENIRNTRRRILENNKLIS